MHTNSITPARVYLHPAAITSIKAIQAIEHATGRLACVVAAGRGIHLLTPAEIARAEAKAGAA
ncbi:hypothetical protein LY622_13760 [Halomonas sp. M5N1S17]|uniref:hypothetical protein n=1 Tax=Halomonas alkalisoli TaxID=2907158 RepID=UPI001F2D270A|nr:hypothetical protein [Halomonas alkalisoli]MCE9664500.1 hypothetical protein [Halomonas alkalisoli]